MMLAHGWALKHWHFAPEFDLEHYTAAQLRFVLPTLVVADRVDDYLTGL